MGTVITFNCTDENEGVYQPLNPNYIKGTNETVSVECVSDYTWGDKVGVTFRRFSPVKLPER